MMRSLAAALLLLTGITAVMAAEPQKADEAEKSADGGDKIICKRFKQTGSLVGSYRTCKSKRDWERERDSVRATANSNGYCGNQTMTGGC